MNKKRIYAICAAFMISCVLSVCTGCQSQKMSHKEAVPTPPPTGIVKDETK